MKHYEEKFYRDIHAIAEALKKIAKLLEENKDDKNR